MVSALVDLGADASKVIEAMKSVHVDGYGVEDVILKEVHRGGFLAKMVNVEAEEAAMEITGLQLVKSVSECAENLKLSREAREFAVASIKTLIEAEARVHGESFENIHLHETGSVDTVADIIGVAVALEDLKIFNQAKVYSTPVAVGGGLFRFSHGVSSSPAPATLEILRAKNFPMIGGPAELELATPTGVSMLVNLVHEVRSFYPSLKPLAVGYGAGAREVAGIPNILRIVLGESLDFGLLKDEVYVLETNLDDVSGEVIGSTLDRLLGEGARDVSVIPMYMKKNRPGFMVKVIVDRADVERLSRILVEETGTLGVRFYPCERRILNRESKPVKLRVNNFEEVVNVKVARDKYGRVIQVKPEYDDVRRISVKSGKSFRELAELVRGKAEKSLKEKEDS